MLPEHEGTTPRYPHARALVHSEHPLVLIGAVRAALRQAGADREELRRFTVDAFAVANPADLLGLCQGWVDVAAEPLDPSHGPDWTRRGSEL